MGTKKAAIPNSISPVACRDNQIQANIKMKIPLTKADNLKRLTIVFFKIRLIR